MGRMGLIVLPGFTISTKFVKYFIKIKKIKLKINKPIKKELKVVEKDVSKKFGDLKIHYYYL